MKIADNRIKIMLDAGHYGNYNPSPVVKGYYEARMAWKLHLMLTEALERYGFIVGHTREDEEKDLDVVARGRKSAGYDLFISLHSNGCNTESVDRVEVYSAYDDLNGASKLSKLLANTIAEIMGVSYGADKTYKSTLGEWEYYGVLRGARSVGTPLYYIIEHSFHSNKRATEWLMDDSNLKALAEAEAAVIAAYYDVEIPDELPVGDVDGDGKVSAKDYAMIKRIILGTYKPSAEELERADVNGDGKVNTVDYAMVKRIVLGTYKP